MPLRRSVPSFRHRSPWGLLAAPLLGLLLLACGGGGGSTAAAPAIAGFTVVQDPVTAGTGAQLTATFSGGTGVVDPGVGTVNSGETRTTPALTADTVFTLTVIGTGGTASRTATVHVAPVPARPVLTLPAAAVAGETGCTASTPTVAGLTYAWSVAGGELTAGDGTGQITFTAGSAGTLQVTCVARNAAGASESASSTIPVQAEPIISHFQASPASIPFGQSSTLTWSVVGATSLRIDPGVGAVTGFSVTVAPAATTIYTLTAANPGGGTLASLTLTVDAVPPSGLGYATPAAVYTRGVRIPDNLPSSSGSPVTAYSVSPALPAGLALDPATGIISGTPASLTASTRCVVTAANQAGSTQAPLTIAVLAAPAAELFLPASAHPGDTWMRASVPVQTGMSYLWDILPGTSPGALVSGQVDGTTHFTAGSSAGTFQVQADVQNQAGYAVAQARSVTVQTGTWLVEDGGASQPRGYASATLLPSGRVLLAGGTDSNFQSLASAELYDPATDTWAYTGAMTTARSGHTATLLADGSVLVAGGTGPAGSLASSEIYQPATGTWSPTAGSLGSARMDHTATLLGDGSVLVAGGYGATADLASSERFDPATGRWTATAQSMLAAREDHTATLLPGGSVLVAGGDLGGTTAEIYTPGTGLWTTAGTMVSSHAGHTATLLANGTVLITGGQFSSTQAELYDPAHGTWTSTGRSTVMRRYHAAALLPNGNVLVMGGQGDSRIPGPPEATYESYNPGTGTWTPGPAMVEPRLNHSAILLPDGTVLVAGGIAGPGGLAVAAAERYDPATGTCAATGGIGTARQYHTATPLGDGTILVAAGQNSSFGCMAGAEIYDPATRIWQPTGSLGTARDLHAATWLANGRVLVTGGNLQSGRSVEGSPSVSSEIFSQGVWSPTGNLAAARFSHTATLLRDGTVLVAGGENGITSLASAEVYDPVAGTWSAAGPMAAARSGHAATLLGDGTVLVVGGGTACERYDPATRTWSATGSLVAGRSQPTLTALQDGTVLAAGGNTAGSADAEIYQPGTGTWTPTAAMVTNRSGHAAVLLRDGRVLVIGGTGSLSHLAACEIFDPVAGAWTAAGSLNAERSQPTANLLGDGTVMVTFGAGGDAVTEIYMP